ncbi:MAG: DUF2520 domain-containing protein [Oligoflexia bacterium]|nr:DUF2520 domain-containing protein [Oligoflexia bacterium]
MKYGIVGDGRVARHFIAYLEQLRLPYAQWSRKAAAANGITVEERLADCDVVLLLVSDSAIEPFAQEHPALREKRLVHFSGALVTPLAQGIHPLMAFGPTLYGPEVYETLAFVAEAGPLKFHEVFPSFPNPVFEIPAELKPRYHALCVLAGNFTVVLWRKLFEEFAGRLGLPAEAALPYLRRIARNLEENPAGALTGPLQRGDLATVTKNLQSLEGDAFQEVYLAFVRACAPALAEKAGLSKP